MLCLGLILDPDGQKMSKSRGNVVAPWDVIDRHGADAFRWYYFTSQQPWSGYRFSLETVGESVRKFLLTLWNTYSFYVLYANVDGFDHAAHDVPVAERPDLDRWVLSRLQGTIATVRKELDSYDTTSAGRNIAAFVDDLSNWYVRRSRRRFWSPGGRAESQDKLSAYLTLHECARRRCRSCWRRSRRSSPTRSTATSTARSPRCTCATFPSPTSRSWTATSSSTWRSRAARSSSAEPRAARPASRCASRCARRSSSPTSESARAIERLESQVLDELNVKGISYVHEAGELADLRGQAQLPRARDRASGSACREAAAAIAALDPDHLAAAFDRGERVSINVGGPSTRSAPMTSRW